MPVRVQYCLVIDHEICCRNEMQQPRPGALSLIRLPRYPMDLAIRWQPRPCSVSCSIDRHPIDRYHSKLSKVPR